MPSAVVWRVQLKSKNCHFYIIYSIALNFKIYYLPLSIYKTVKQMSLKIPVFIWL